MADGDAETRLEPDVRDKQAEVVLSDKAYLYRFMGRITHRSKY